MSTTSLSRRAKFDLASLVAAGVVSSVFFALAAWNAQRTATAGMNAVQVEAARPVVQSAAAAAVVLAGVDAAPAAPAPAAQRRTASRTARAPKPAPAAVRVKADARPAQSRLARFLLGDGSETVQPFPVRAER